MNGIAVHVLAVINFFEPAATSPLSGVLLAVGVVATAAFIVSVITLRKSTRLRSAVAISVGLALLSLSIIIASAAILIDGILGARQESTESYQAQILDAYGAQLTDWQVRGLGFPSSTPNKPTVFSTISVLIGDGIDSTTQDIRLIWDGDTFRLLTRAPADSWVDLSTVNR